MEKIPYLAVAGLGAIVVLFARNQGAQWSPFTAFGVDARLALAAYSFWFYPTSTVWPVGLTPLHEVPIGPSLTQWRLPGPARPAGGRHRRPGVAASPAARAARGLGARGGGRGPGERHRPLREPAGLGPLQLSGRARLGPRRRLRRRAGCRAATPGPGERAGGRGRRRRRRAAGGRPRARHLGPERGLARLGDALALGRRGGSDLRDVRGDPRRGDRLREPERPGAPGRGRGSRPPRDRACGPPCRCPTTRLGTMRAGPGAVRGGRGEPADVHPARARPRPGPGPPGPHLPGAGPDRGGDPAPPAGARARPAARSGAPTGDVDRRRRRPRPRRGGPADGRALGGPRVPGGGPGPAGPRWPGGAAARGRPDPRTGGIRLPCLARTGLRGDRPARASPGSTRGAAPHRSGRGRSASPYIDRQ